MAYCLNGERWMVWKGHRDYEENVAVCATLALAEEFLASNNVYLRDDPAPQIKAQSLMDADFVPWGIEKVQNIERHA